MPATHNRATNGIEANQEGMDKYTGTQANEVH